MKEAPCCTDQGGNTCGHEGNRTGNKRFIDQGNRGERHPKTGKDTRAGVQPVYRRHKSTVSGRTVLRGSVALRPDGSVLRTADDFRRFPICSNHHRGRGQLRCPAPFPFPCAGSASCPFVALPPENLSESLFHLASQSCIMEPAKNRN